MIDEKLKNIITEAFRRCRAEDGWVNLASLGNQIRGLDPNFNAEAYGFDRLSSLLAAQQELLELRRDNSRHVPVVYGKLYVDGASVNPLRVVRNKARTGAWGKWGSVCKC